MEIKTNKIKRIMLSREKDFKHNEKVNPEPHTKWVRRLFKNYRDGDSNLVDWFKIVYEEAQKDLVLDLKSESESVYKFNLKEYIEKKLELPDSISKVEAKTDRFVKNLNDDFDNRLTAAQNIYIRNFMKETFFTEESGESILDEVVKNLKLQGFEDAVKYDVKGKATHYDLRDAIQNWG